MPRPQLINSPAPSLVEATLGAANAAPTLAEAGEARNLLARLIAEGSAVPLNLLGAPSTTADTPDFVASAATFSYVFTLRGDKAFKQPPSTSGATKVSPLALNAYTLLVENGPTSAYDLATQLGKEVTEAAVLRSLNELWQNLRVLPVPEPEGGRTLWETVANRFTKQLKAGANAGQPTALSALISLYLSQALVATETEIETFLSPLAPRSRVRDVLHALTGARQLETIAIEGKTHLHIHGELAAFASGPVEAQAEDAGDSGTSPVEIAEDGSRIKKFIAKPRKVGTGYIERAKPFGGADRPAARAALSSERGGPQRGGAGRPFGKPSGTFGRTSSDRTSRPAFNKPWDEERDQRAAREAAQNAVAPSGDGQQPEDVDLHASSAPGTSHGAPASRPAKRPFGSGSRFGGDRPSASRRPGSGGDRPAFSRGRDDSAGRPPRREFTPREGGDARPPRRDFAAGGRPSFGDRKPFVKSGFGDRKREFPDRTPGGRPPFGDKERRPFRRDDAPGGERPPRREFAPREGGDSRAPRREFTPRGDRPSWPKREGFSKPTAFRDRPTRPEGEGSGRPERPAFRKFDAPRGPRKPFAPREGGEARPPRREFPGAGKPTFGPRKSFEGPRPDGGGSGAREGGYAGKREGGGYAGKREGGGYAGKREGGGYAGKREGNGYAGKKPFAGKPSGFAGKKPFAGRSGGRGPDAPGASTFDKFKGGNKPWGKRPPGRKPKPEAGEA